MGVAQSLANAIAGLQTAQSGLSGSLSALKKDAGQFTVIASHPRFWGTPAEVADLLAEAATPEGQAIVKSQSAMIPATVPSATKDTSGDRTAACAFCYRFGSQLGMTPTQVQNAGIQLVADLLATPVSEYGTEACMDWSGTPWALGYDWGFSLLTPTQIQTLLAEVDAALAPAKRISSNTTWSGYNQLSGDVPMAAALATYGETTTEYVKDVYDNNWFANKPTWWNYAWQKIAFANGGSREGYFYFCDGCYSNFLARGFWETATGGDQSLAIEYFRTFALWTLFQIHPDTLVKGRLPWNLYTTVFAGGGSQRQAWGMLESLTKFGDPASQQIARWLIDNSLGWPGVNRSSGDALLFGLLIGDPRIKGADPATLSIPKYLLMEQPGELYVRSDWTAQSNIFWFGNHTTGSRVTPAGEFMLYSKGAYLFGNAAHRIGHSYAPRWLSCGFCFVDSTGVPNGGNYPGGSVPDYKSLGTFTATKTPTGWQIIASAAPNFAKPPTQCDLVVTCDDAVQNVTIQATVVCDPTWTPHLVLPCPTQPVMNAGGSVSVVNGAASCTLTFDAPPAQLLAIGGVDHYADGLPGTAYAGKPYLFSGTVLDTTFDPLQRKTDPASIAATLQQMGLWRLHIVFPAGGGTITTTIKVQ